MGTFRPNEDLGGTLLRLKKTLEEEKNNRAELQGEFNSIMKQLNREFEVDSLEAAEKMIQKEEKRLEEVEQNLIKEAEEIERLMEEGAGKE